VKCSPVKEIASKNMQVPIFKRFFSWRP